MGVYRNVGVQPTSSLQILPYKLYSISVTSVIPGSPRNTSSSIYCIDRLSLLLKDVYVFLVYGTVLEQYSTDIL